jgi:hypothetical protein
MKTEWPSDRIRTLLLCLGLLTLGVASASAQDTHIYAARMSSNTDTNWDVPFRWMGTPGSAYSISTGKSLAPGVPPDRVGSYFHTLREQIVGDGFGVVCTECSAIANMVYRVEITQPHTRVGTDTLFGVCSTNCSVGGLSGGASYATNTTAFQAANSTNKWGFVCYLTNTTGVANPEIEFHFVSATDPDGLLRNYADCVRFTEACCPPVLWPAQITGIAGVTLTYSGGRGARFILLKSPSLGAGPGSWERVDTNYAMPGSFTIPDLGAAASAFYRIQSE